MITLRPGDREEDPALCARLYFEAVRKGGGPHYNNEQRIAWAPEVPSDAAWSERIRTGYTLIAERDERPVGFMVLATDGSIDLAFVLAEERGKGVSSALYDALLREAIEQGLTQLTTHASLFFRPFLERRGWEVVETEHVERHGSTLVRFAMIVDPIRAEFDPR